MYTDLKQYVMILENQHSQSQILLEKDQASNQRTDSSKEARSSFNQQMRPNITKTEGNAGSLFVDESSQ